MRRSIPALLLGLAAIIFVPHSAPAAGQGLKWRSWDVGLKESGTAKKPVLVDVYTDWCGWCKRMDRDVYGKTEVSDYLAKKFVVVKLNAESESPASYDGRPYTERSLATKFRVNGYPTTIFLGTSGEHLVNVPGYVPADDFLVLLRYIGDGAYQRGITFDQFKKSGGSGGK